MHIRLTIQLFALSLWLTACGGGQQTATEEVAESALPAWALGEFVRPEGKNPVIIPNPESRFDCPMRQVSVGWEESDTFNPAAVVKDDTICVL